MSKVNSGSLGLVLLVALLFYTTENSFCSPLPADVPMNEEAGRGGLLIVPLRLASGEELPFLVDTGSGTCFDKSLAPKLGQPLGTTTVQSWGVKKEENIYAMPKIYLGGVPLMTEDRTLTYDIDQSTIQSSRPIMGILGGDCLRHYCVQLDFTAGKMRFLDDQQADRRKWGQPFPIVPLNDQDGRPAVAENLFGAHGPHSLIDSGYDSDGWLMPKFFQQWTNHAAAPAQGEARSPGGLFGGEKYPLISLGRQNVESDGIGIRFLARHLVTLDFPKQTMYLQIQTIAPLPDLRYKTTPMAALDAMIKDVTKEDTEAARLELARLEQSNATALEKTVARKLEATLAHAPKLAPADAPPGLSRLALGDARPETAEAGWLTPAQNRIPLSEEVASPLLDSGRIFATGLFAHAPSRYVFQLGGQWQKLRGAAGLHTAFQPYAYGVVFVIKTDGKEVFRSGDIRGTNQVSYDIDLANVKALELQVEKASDQNGGNWALWLDPTLFRVGAENAKKP